MNEIAKIKRLISTKLLEADEDDEDIFTDDDIDALEDTDTDEESEVGDEDLDSDDEESDDDSDMEDGSEEVEDTEEYSSDEEKVNSMFKDIGDPEVDYSLTNENNIRLYTFKFKNAGIDPFTLMTEVEKVQGVRADEIEGRLTPDQLEIYKEKNKDLRNTYDLIKVREKNIIVYNSNVSFFINDEKGVPEQITKPVDIDQAIKKVIVYMDRNFGDDWADNKDAIEFLQNIKINFSEQNKIRPNLISVDFFVDGDDNSLIPFNKMYSEIPSIVDKFIKQNQDNDDYKTSSIFRTFVDDFVGRGVGGSRVSVYPVIRMGGDADATGELVGGDEETEDEGGGDEFGGLGDLGGGDEGEEDLGGEDLGEEPEEELEL